MLEQLREKLKGLLEQRSDLVAKRTEILAAPQAESRDLTEDETSSFQELREEIKGVDAEIDRTNDTLSELEDMEKRDAEREALASQIQPKPNANPQVHVRSEPVTYAKGQPTSFFADMFAVRSGQGDVLGASERLTRHMTETANGAHAESRASAATVATGNFSSLVVPQYLPEMFAENLYAGRVTANLASSHPLPAEGMTLSIPRATDPTLVAAQTDQNVQVASAQFDSEDLVVNVRTYAGQQNVSRQSIDRGRGTDEVIYADLASNYTVQLDRDVINGPPLPNAGRHVGLLNTSGIATITTAETTAGGQLRRVAEAAGVVNSRRFLPADAIVVHPRRWAFWCGSVDGNGRPLVLPDANGPRNAFGVGDQTVTEQRVGQVGGFSVYTDANIPTDFASGTNSDEDVVIVMRRGDLHLWEDGIAPMQFRFEETLGGQLTVKLVIASYSAFTAGHHPEGIAVLQGPGLAAPDFS